jgi:hypothetical protein
MLTQAFIGEVLARLPIAAVRLGLAHDLGSAETSAEPLSALL